LSKLAMMIQKNRIFFINLFIFRMIRTIESDGKSPYLPLYTPEHHIFNINVLLSSFDF
jgi:hypothetical protein